jgi:hypothetical protein
MDNKNLELVGYCAVDSGTLYITDPCYLSDVEEYEEFKKQWDSMGIGNGKQFNFKLGHEGLGVVIEGFGGDGVYPVYVTRGGKYGLVTSIVIKLNED